jgi:inner membrane protein
MDNLTHTLFALTLARTPLGRAGRGTTTALVLASSAPDIDILMTARGNASYLQWHRGPTHGLIGVAVLGVIVALLVRAGQRVVDRRGARPPDDPEAPFGLLLAASVIGIGFHILMDFPTSYGTRLLSPFDWHWFATDLMPIVDIYLIIIMVAGLLFGSASAAARRRNAAIVLALMAANYGVRAVARHQAIGLAPRVFGPTLPQRCDGGVHNDQALLSVWPHEINATPAKTTTGSRCLVEIAAMPSFFSPFRWRLIAQMSNAYEMHDVDVLDARLRRPLEAGEAPWRVTVRYPNQWSPVVWAAAANPIPQAFLGFSRFPAARWFTDPRTGETTARWTDMRFAAGLTLDQRVGRASFFSVTVRLDRDGRLVEEKLGQ